MTKKNYFLSADVSGVSLKISWQKVVSFLSFKIIHYYSYLERPLVKLILPTKIDFFIHLISSFKGVVLFILYLFPLLSYLNLCHFTRFLTPLCRVELSFNQIMNERRKKGVKIHKRTRSESCFLSSLEACCDKSVSLGRRQMSTANWQESFIRRQSQVGHAVLPRKKTYVFSLGQCTYSYYSKNRHLEF